jgi:hypothetical protein
MIDPRKTTATTGVEKTVKETMETTTMEVVTTTTQDAVRTNTKETSRRRIANPDKVTQMGEGVEMIQIHHRTTIQIGERGAQRKTKRRTENPERNAQGAMTTEEEMTHRLTVKQRIRATCPTDGERGFVKIPAIPKSLFDLGDFQFNVKNCIRMASGRYNLRIKWIDATLSAQSLTNLQRVPKTLTSLDIKLSMACVAACQLARNVIFVNALRDAGRQLCANGSEMATGRQCLWIIYKHFASPNDGDTDRRLSPNYSVLDLQLIKLQGGDEGLERYWAQWISTIANRPDEGGPRSVFQHLFVDEMRLAPLVESYVHIYDEADAGTDKHTWEWLLKKGQASFQRKRERDNLLRKQKGLRGINP